MTSGEFKPTSNEFQEIIERFAQKEDTEEDREKLRSLAQQGLLRLEGNVVQLVNQDGKYNINVNEIAAGAHIGDRFGPTPEEIIAKIKPLIEGHNQSKIEGHNQSKRPTWKAATVASILVVIGVTVSRFVGILQPLELMAYDWLLQSTSSFNRGVDNRIAIIEITNQDLPEGSNVISDQALQKILKNLLVANPFKVGLDILRHEPKTETENEESTRLQDYEELIDLLQTNKFVIACSDDTNFPASVPLDNIQLGFSNIVIASDDKAKIEPVRRVLLKSLKDEDERSQNCPTLDALGYKLALDYLQQQGIVESRNQQRNYLQLGDTIIDPVWPYTGGYQRIDSRGYQILLNYFPNPFETFTASQILDGLDEEEVKKIEGRIVFVGYNDENIQTHTPDLHKTPLGTKAGVELHAHIASNILGAVLNDKFAPPLIRSLIEAEEILWIFLWCAIGGIMARSAAPKGILFISIVGGSVVLTIICYAAFAFAGWWLPSIPALLGLGGTATGAVVWAEYRIARRRHPIHD